MISRSLVMTLIHSFFKPRLCGGGWRGGRVVYCGGLENRFGFTADGGSNPSLSANQQRGGWTWIGAEAG